MKLVLFHDALALCWTPFVETRPIGELMYGTRTLRERALRALGAEASLYAAAPHLAGFDETGAPPVGDPSASAGDDRVFLCVRAAVDPPLEPLDGRRPAVLTLEGRTVGWVVPAGAPAPTADAMRDLPRAGIAASVGLAGELLERPWHLMAGNARRIAADAAAEPGVGAGATPAGAHRIGDHPILLEDGAVVEPGVVLDARSGPIWLARGARIEGPARATGPLYLGAGSTILGGPVGSSSIGPMCKVRGEVADSILCGYCNKAHDGHLGHAVLGRWVNLGAGTTNSDLKNTYSSVRVRLPEGDVDTGLIKVGSFLGDHVKTGIGTPLNTGTVIGAGSNLFGGRMPPLYVPPLSWGEGAELVEYRLERFLAAAATAMGRRQVELSEGMRQVLGRAAERGRNERTS